MDRVFFDPASKPSLIQLAVLDRAFFDHFDCGD
jgi:hypothetical protein